MSQVKTDGKPSDVAVPEHYRYIHGFPALLESVFQITGPDTVVRIKSAAEFAEQCTAKRPFRQ